MDQKRKKYEFGGPKNVKKIDFGQPKKVKINLADQKHNNYLVDQKTLK